MLYCHVDRKMVGGIGRLGGWFYSIDLYVHVIHCLSAPKGK